MPKPGIHLAISKAAKYIEEHGLKAGEILPSLLTKQVQINGRWYFDLNDVQLEIIRRGKKPMNVLAHLSQYQRSWHKEKVKR